MAYKGQFFALYSDGTSALAASERELSELRGDRVEITSGHAEALDADPELSAVFEHSRETPEARAERLATATVDELAAELIAGGNRASIVDAIAIKAMVAKVDPWTAEALEDKIVRLETASVDDLLLEAISTEGDIQALVIETLIQRSVDKDSTDRISPKAVRSLSGALVKEEGVVNASLLKKKPVIETELFGKVIMYNLIVYNWLATLYGFWYLLNV